ncbi:enoyl-CoA hydratase/isomerase family protein [Frankia sp. CNm7]|uniref:Enoyl-CoA hydratase/isomerase family protein n=1 Tax=Frankia nepalensis TaxID=1836974 RepID=A0A937UR59_9ACTN|nr:enoyl-CoA hydratase-related protein [Frankia nepalensis]MBL7496667.1 enoyl-CoA hydratase/isomerase family protein [Frankia nepalensis]MBL7510691.1 enoyl-CoA hydratase/isomerase family protein [Frankia nepalensis]MBL7516676.1 enoyl-CoA hydratase/isomerase family protein [Frankia nepalensis]MBL7627406.1 enoyl-CoA hydratase/isomerase family protein [Frankia nepalensis]
MTVLFDLTDGVATLTLHRPEVRNAFGGAMARDLVAAYERCDTDDAVRAVVLTGTPPAFCAGADMTSGGDTFASPDSSTFSAAGLGMPAWRVRKPVIAAVNGHAIGIGFTLTLQCDIRIFAADAKYGIVQARRGVLGDAYSHWTLPRIAGMSGAAEILLTGRTFNGQEAHGLGVCSRVLPNDEVLPAALALARDIAANTAPLSVAYSKRLLWDSWGLDPAGVEARETAAHHHTMGAPDAREGVLAFLERRPPRWRGSVATEWSDD